MGGCADLEFRVTMQSLNAGVLPTKEIKNVFVAQAFDAGDPCAGGNQCCTNKKDGQGGWPCFAGIAKYTGQVSETGFWLEPRNAVTLWRCLLPSPSVATSCSPSLPLAHIRRPPPVGVFSSWEGCTRE